MHIDYRKEFGVRECPSCATEVKINNNRCPICGYEFPCLRGRRKTLQVGMALLMLILLGLMLLRALSGR
ncbi:MAG TPA: zinc ribbon domain-containing protein [Kiritimatiellae bacterium]|nr:zinc ribbon domain-containing protein [Kiritimatiellia bacterium]